MAEDDLLPKGKKKEYLIYGGIGVAVILVAAYIQRQTNLNGSASSGSASAQQPVIVSGGSSAPDLSPITDAINTLQSTEVQNQQANEQAMTALQTSMTQANQQNQAAMTALGQSISTIGSSFTSAVSQINSQNQANNQQLIETFNQSNQSSLNAITNLFNSRQTTTTPTTTATSTLPTTTSTAGTTTAVAPPTYTPPTYIAPVTPVVAPTYPTQVVNPNPTTTTSSGGSGYSSTPVVSNSPVSTLNGQPVLDTGKGGSSTYVTNNPNPGQVNVTTVPNTNFDNAGSESNMPPGSYNIVTHNGSIYNVDTTTGKAYKA